MGLACTRGDAPSDPVWGKEPCAHCAMLVSDKRYAAEIVTDGDRKFFDDIGCMVLWLDEHGGKAEHSWVRTPDAARWSDATSSHYAEGAKTPMDFGFEPKAGDGLGWAEMRDRVRSRRIGR